MQIKIQLTDQPSQSEALQMLADAFWNTGGQEKYEATKAARDVNGIPDSQWLKANLMGLIDDATATFEN